MLFGHSHLRPPTDATQWRPYPKAEKLFGSQVSALGFLVQVFRCRYRPQARTRTWTCSPVPVSRGLRP